MALRMTRSSSAGSSGRVVRTEGGVSRRWALMTATSLSRGKGVEAASTTSLVRHSLRTATRFSSSPSGTLEATRLALVEPPRKLFPPEPFRYVGGSLIRRALVAKDAAEDEGRQPTARTRLVASLPRRLGLRLPR